MYFSFQVEARLNVGFLKTVAHHAKASESGRTF
jgi:hypothetical protein